MLGGSAPLHLVLSNLESDRSRDALLITQYSTLNLALNSDRLRKLNLDLNDCYDSCQISGTEQGESLNLQYCISI